VYTKGNKGVNKHLALLTHKKAVDRPVDQERKGIPFEQVANNHNRYYYTAISAQMSRNYEHRALVNTPLRPAEFPGTIADYGEVEHWSSTTFYCSFHFQSP